MKEENLLGYPIIDWKKNVSETETSTSFSKEVLLDIAFANLIANPILENGEETKEVPISSKLAKTFLKIVGRELWENQPSEFDMNSVFYKEISVHTANGKVSIYKLIETSAEISLNESGKTEFSEPIYIINYELTFNPTHRNIGYELTNENYEYLMQKVSHTFLKQETYNKTAKIQKYYLYN